VTTVFSRQATGSISTSRHRTDVGNQTEEHWQPPPFARLDGPTSRAITGVRRLFDVQASSIWNDLAGELKAVRGTLLDVGCGAQPYRTLVPADVEYIGIDTADAKDRFGYDLPDTLYFTGNRWPVDDATADTVLCTETLEHVLDSLGFLAEAKRSLRPGGRLILTVPFAARWHYVPFDYWRFTPSGLKYLLAESGFTKVKVYRRGNALTVACYKVIALILPLLMPRKKGVSQRLILRVGGIALSPLLAASTIVARLSLRRDGGDDCLGYTVLAISTPMAGCHDGGGASQALCSRPAPIESMRSS
jgi:SAM-dependent methyltransferase